ncbi:Succinyl-CoA--L-malate CoA-transferase alpha subunit [Meiothermus luteus]|jgi:formyl-CoA transferase/succinyl-CoA--D-citramalate CoA-transferase|uniref:Succinyl-CoA--L-malate CoA-transferase alpha subunit n=1 Tax=Meiothermus luteus TaxID=2026184 RepID=A0A399EIF2_9DEIN|nr:CoA transferase [Meiothermus luteus]RIH83738.1 Succinyl-CoA--L-malate CoA-transferase alpha subunit [Meiothermus luteus]RMH55437.1 MAG: CoA transferase [Deinococcota bacterium]
MGALDGVRVLELGSFIAGPFAGQLLADHGAEVIKVEPPEGDAMRRWGVQLKEGESLWWPVIGRNKKSVVLDLRTERGRRLARELALRVDVLLENFRPGVLERLGLEPEALMAENPRLIVARVSGFGQSGPYRDRAGFGSVAEAMGGLRYLTGFPDRPPPRVGLSIGDTLAGLFTAFGILAALRAREQTGQGQIVDVGLTDAVVAVLESVLTEYSALGVVRERTGNILPGVAPSNLYPTQEGRYIQIGANADGPFARLCQAMGRPELAQDPRFATHLARGAHQTLLDEIIAGWTRTLSLEELDRLLAEHGVPAGPVNSAREVAQDPHFRERGTLLEVETPLGRLVMQGVVPKLSATPGGIAWAGPPLGAHTESVLRAFGLEN